MILVDPSSKQQNSRFQNFSVEQDTFIVMSCYRNGIFLNKECVYSVTGCKQQYLAKYRDLIIQETSLEAHMRDVFNRFIRTGSVNKGKSHGRPSVSEEVGDDLRRLAQNSQNLLSNQEFLLQYENEPWTLTKILRNIFEIKKSVNMCLEQSGEHFQHLL